MAKQTLVNNVPFLEQRTKINENFTEVYDTLGAIESKGIPVAFSNRGLSDSDDGGVFICAAARIATIPAGLKSNFGCTFKGEISFTASGTTVNDIRQTGFKNPWCSLVCVGENLFDVVGGKA